MPVSVFIFAIVSLVFDILIVANLWERIPRRIGRKNDNDPDPSLFWELIFFSVYLLCQLLCLRFLMVLENENSDDGDQVWKQSIICNVLIFYK